MRRKANTYFLILFMLPVLFANSRSYAQEEVKALFDKANSFYMNGQFEDAESTYISIIEKGYHNASVYYNLGNVYYKLGNIGKAILYYEKAKKINPRDDDIITNLNMASLAVADKITPLPELFYVKYVKLFVSLLGLSGWVKIFLILFGVLCVTLCGFMLSRNERLRFVLRKGIVVLSVLTVIIFAVTIYASYEINRHDEAVVMNEKVDVYASPNEDSTELFAVHEGTKVSIKRIQGKWMEIKLADGKVGWIVKECAEVI